MWICVWFSDCRLFVSVWYIDCLNDWLIEWMTNGMKSELCGWMNYCLINFEMDY